MKSFAVVQWVACRIAIGLQWICLAIVAALVLMWAAISQPRNAYNAIRDIWRVR